MKKYIALKDYFVEGDIKRVQESLLRYQYLFDDVIRFQPEMELQIVLEVAKWIYVMADCGYTSKRFLIDVPPAVIKLAGALEIKLSTCVSALFLVMEGR